MQCVSKLAGKGLGLWVRAGSRRTKAEFSTSARLTQTPLAVRAFVVTLKIF